MDLHRKTPRMLAAVVCLFFGMASQAWAESWPTRPVRLVVPLAVGGGVDAVARILAAKLGAALGQPVVVENQGGAGGTLATGYVARSPADGYTLIFSSTSAAVINALVYKNLPYDPVKDFAPVSLFATSPLVAVINPQVPVRDLPEFLALLRANPGKYSYGSSGYGTITHLAGEYFKSLAKVDIVHVPYRGNAAVLPDLFGGRISLMFDSLPLQIPNIRSGKVRAIGLLGNQKSPELPDVPLMKETLPGFELQFWMGVYAPARTPKPIVERLAAEISKVAADPEVVANLARLGVDSRSSSPGQFDAFWHEQLRQYGKIVQANHIMVD
ncbi:tripartite tricarboxylate transporter substrate binding protein [Pigmentiphaga soli]|uniref:Tripartite tricarboxylate transporter substrate binding protein n=1 Tax=Pigmentiphaga soli TaxID=1007095 RepID=A0ABP8H4J6_9BURK